MPYPCKCFAPGLDVVAKFCKFVSAAQGSNGAADNSHGDDESGMQFIGFYSDYLVTDKVRVDSKMTRRCTAPVDL